MKTGFVARLAVPKRLLRIGILEDEFLYLTAAATSRDRPRGAICHGHMLRLEVEQLF